MAHVRGLAGAAASTCVPRCVCARVVCDTSYPVPDARRLTSLVPAAGDCTTISYQVKQAYEK